MLPLFLAVLALPLLLLLFGCGGARKKKADDAVTTPAESKPAPSAVKNSPPQLEDPGRRQKPNSSIMKSYDLLAATEKLGRGEPALKTAKEPRNKSVARSRKDDKPLEQTPPIEKDKTEENKTNYNVTEHLDEKTDRDATDQPGKSKKRRTVMTAATKEDGKDKKGGGEKVKSGVKAAPKSAPPSSGGVEETAKTPEAGFGPASTPTKSSQPDSQTPLTTKKSSKKELPKSAARKDAEKKGDKKETKEEKKEEGKLDQSQVETIVKPASGGAAAAPDADNKTIDVDAALAPTPPTARSPRKMSGKRGGEGTSPSKSPTGKSHMKTPEAQPAVEGSKKKKKKVNATQLTEHSSFLPAPQ